MHFISVPTFPGDGLLLDECLFTRFNKKKQNEHNPPLLRSTYEPMITAMKNQLYQFIISNEKKTNNMARWTYLLPYFVRSKKEKKTTEPQQDDEDMDDAITADDADDG